MKKLTALLLTLVMLLASTCHAESLTDELGLTSESKPATTYTVEINSAVYSQLDFSDTSEYDNATRGLITAPEVLELKDADGKVVWSQAAYSFLDNYEQAPTPSTPACGRTPATTTPTACSRYARASIRYAAMTCPT